MHDILGIGVIEYMPYMFENIRNTPKYHVSLYHCKHTARLRRFWSYGIHARKFRKDQRETRIQKSCELFSRSSAAFPNQVENSV